MTEELSPKATEIIAHTRQLLAAGGYHSFSYADISELVKISKASIHHHFPSKAILVRATVADYRAEARRGMEHVTAEFNDPLQELNAYAGFWAACLETATMPFCICALLATEAPTIPAEVADEVRGHFEDLHGWLVSVLERGREGGQLILRDSCEIEARVLMAAAHGAMVSARALNDPAIFRMIIEPAVARLRASA